MKKLCILPALLFLSNLAWSQNWIPVNSYEKYNYSTGNYNYYATIWVDSSALINNDSVYFLNKVIKKVADVLDPEWPDYAVAYYLENQSQFFLSKIISSVNGDIEMLENDSIKYLIKPYAGLNDTWVFDSLRADTATVIDLSETLVFGNTDSIKVIKLSGNDTIVLSKNYGILKFPIFDSIHQHINLVGIEGRNAGLVIPKFNDFFNFGVGDVFCYKEEMFFHVPQTEYRKITIKSKDIQGDSILYFCQLKSMLILVYAEDTIYNDEDVTLIYVDSLNHFLNKYSNQILNSRTSGSKYKPVKVSSSFILDSLFLITKSYPFQPLEKKSGSDTIIDHGDIYPGTGLDVGETNIYGTNIGLISDSSLHYYPMYPVVHSENLIGCIKDGIIYGNILDDFMFLSIPESPIIKPNFAVYPNPVTDVITIKAFINNVISRFVILDVNGKEQYSDQLTGNEVNVDISNLQSGIYFIKLITEDTVEVRKIIKE